LQVLDCLTRCVEIEPDAPPTADANVAAAGMDVDGFRVALQPSELQLVLRQTQAGVQSAALRLVTALVHKRGGSVATHHPPAPLTAAPCASEPHTPSSRHELLGHRRRRV
jgi:hypothetical protein